VNFKFQFLEFLFETLHFQRLPAPMPEEGLALELNQRMNIQAELKENLLVVRLGVELGQEGLPFALAVVIAGRFQFPEVPDPTALDPIVHINCAGILFPFVREAVADLTRKGGFTPILLPPVNFVELYQESKKVKAAELEMAPPSP
jgi:preprotein translocase subunit SecB